MNPLRILYGTAIGAALALVGCSPEKEPEPSTPPRSHGSATGQVQSATSVAEVTPTNPIQVTNVSTAQGSTEVIGKAVDIVTTNLQAGAAAVVDRTQGILDAAKKQIDEKKWSEALSALEGLVGQQLTPDQQVLLQSLKEQAQKAIQAAGAAKVGGEASRLLEGARSPK